MVEAQWVAVNDQGGTTNTHPNATRYHVFAFEDGSGGALRDLATGGELPVTLSMTRSGFVSADSLAGTPAPGTPLYDAFAGLADFTSPSDNAGMSSSGQVTWTLGGLRPGRSYVLQFGAVRGATQLVNRWTLMTLTGAADYSALPSNGILTSNQVAELAANQAAASFGANHTPETGDMMTWGIHDAGEDGQVNLVFSAYTGEVPGGSSPQGVGYIPTALKVSELPDDDQITILDPPRHQSAQVGEAVEFSVVAGGFPLFYQWFRDGTPIAGATRPTYRLEAVAEADDGARFSVMVSNLTDSVLSGPAILTILSPPLLLVPYGQSWSYDNAGVDLGTAWRELAFDDSAWPAGPGPLGFPATEATPVPIATPLSSHNDITYYFRTRFVFDEFPTDFELLLTNFVDDGAVFYLNGKELVRPDMPPPPTEIVFATPAAVGGEWVLRSDVLSSDALRTGTNVFAAEVHQVTSTSSDMVMGMSLWALSRPPEPVRIVQQPSDVTIEEGQATQLSVVAEGAGRRFQWFHSGQPVEGATGPILELDPARPSHAGEYFVMVSNQVSMVLSKTIILEVTADLTPPRLAVADGTLGPGEIYLTFSEPVRMVSATNNAPFRLITTEGIESAVLEVEWITDTMVRLRTEVRMVDRNYLVAAHGFIDLAEAPNAIAPDSRTPVVTLLKLLPFDASWHFYDPVVGIDPPLSGSSWMDPAYPAEDWGFGMAGFVFDLSTQAWPVPPRTLLAGGVMTGYFRTTFDYIASPFGAELQLRHAVDDGALFYLNGEEVLRHNLPAGLLDSSTRALTEVISVNITSASLPPRPLPRYGANVLAAELHSASAGDKDRFFAAALQARISSLATGPVLVLSDPTNTAVIEGRSATFHCETVGASGIQWFLDGEPVVGANEASVVFPSVRLSDDGALVHALATNQTSTATSGAATLSVLPDLIPPRLVSAHAELASTSVLIIFDEAISAASATNQAHYRLQTVSGEIIEITAVSQTDPGQVWLTTLTPLGSEAVILTVTGVTDIAAAPNPVSPGSRVRVGLSGSVLPLASTWAYEDSGAEPSFDWTDPAADVSAWAAGPAPLGFPSTQPLPLGLSLQTEIARSFEVPTYYFRTQFEFPAGSPGTVTFSNLVDDGAVFHLNGDELFRLRMPTGTIGHDTTASTSTELGTDLDSFDVVQFPADQFLGGTNVLSVDVHNFTSFGSDIIFATDLFLESPSEILPPLPPAVLVDIRREETGAVLFWDHPSAVLETTPSLNGTNTIWTPLPEADSPFQLPLSESAAFYRLRE